MKDHFSWQKMNENLQVSKDIPEIQEVFKNHYETKMPKVYDLQNDIIPVYNLSLEDLNNSDIQEDLHNTFFFYTGIVIIKNAYNPKIMDDYNKWCSDNLDVCKLDKNNKHPKQSDKFLLNNIVGRMSESNPDLLMELINNDYFTSCIDILGVSKIGSSTGHWINPNSDRQSSHVDYPSHIGSGEFWNNSVDKYKNLITKYQSDYVLPFFSTQVLIAPQKMNKNNGSTEVVPCSHLLQDLDVLIQDKNIYEDFEKSFMNIELDKGDMLLFNRGLCHRGGKNISSEPLNSLTIQCVWLWGVGQEIIESSKVLERLEKSQKFNELDQEKKDKFKLRIDFPYPTNVKNSA